jgi:hypothetical protein
MEPHSVEKVRKDPVPIFGMVGIGNEVGLNGSEKLLKDTDPFGQVGGPLSLKMVRKIQVGFRLEGIDDKVVQGGPKTLKAPTQVEGAGL